MFGLKRFFRRGDKIVFMPGTGRHPDLNATVKRYPGPHGPNTIGIVLEGQSEERVSPLSKVRRR